MLLLVEVNIPFLHSFNTLCVREIRNRKQKEIDSVILLIDYSKFCLFYNVKVFEKMYFGNFMDFLDYWFFWFFMIFWDFLGFFRKNPRVYEDFFELTTPRRSVIMSIYFHCFYPRGKGWIFLHNSYIVELHHYG